MVHAFLDRHRERLGLMAMAVAVASSALAVRDLPSAFANLATSFNNELS